MFQTIIQNENTWVIYSTNLFYIWHMNLEWSDELWKFALFSNWLIFENY